ncbi:MAG TPA: proton-conducting transporter membrane subunit [Candidatus Cloacimonadota bacterium]|nr:proton-conducting transporter membrane subunit [Candidatus Cloacimonadota bacterium]
MRQKHEFAGNPKGNMHLFIIGCFIIFCGGLYSLIINNNKGNSISAILGIWIGGAICSFPVIRVLLGNSLTQFDFNWSLLGGSLSFGMDSLSAFFCLPILLISPFAVLYGKSYMKEEAGRLSSHWFFFTILIISMLLLTTARNAVMFLILWEIMAISSFFLVMHDHEKASVREAGWTYLVATHIGTAALLIFFAWFGSEAGSMQFDQMAAVHPNAWKSGILFLLAVFGFGVKAGIIPLHVWLPEAHPAAPSHVSALMSGVMIKTGIYGILRALVLLGTPTEAWGWLLLIIGLLSGIYGVVFALAQHDIKRLLAYHSVENIGIITMGLGAGILGLVWHLPFLVFLGFGGGLLHVLNHAIFKSLLFFGAGSVAHATGTRDIEKLGGLIKKMRWTGASFLIGSAAIAGLPPLNGFVSEFYIYLAGINGIRTGMPGPIILATIVLVGLALIGGLAVACFTKAFGIMFQGEPREVKIENVHESDLLMRIPMLFLALLCILIGVFAPVTINWLIPPVQVLAGNQMTDFIYSSLTMTIILVRVSIIFITLFILTAILYFFKRLLPRAKTIAATGTWDCGYAKPTSRMQYTASSFAQPITNLFKSILGTEEKSRKVEGYFPRESEFESHTQDIFRRRMFEPFFKLVSKWVSPFRRIQHGNLHGYLLYIALTLIILLIWKVGFAR